MRSTSWQRPRQFHRNRRALTFACAFSEHLAAVLFRNRFHDEQTQPGSFHMRQRAPADAVEALEDVFHIVGRNPYSAVLDAEHYVFLVWRVEVYTHLHMIARILDGIVEHVEYSGTQVFLAAQHTDPGAIARCLLEAQSLRRQMVADSRGLHAGADHLTKIDGGFLPARFLIPGAACAQHLLHRLGQAISMAEHHAVEFLSLRLRQVAALQGFQMQPDGSDRPLQLVSHRVDEAVVLLAAAKLANQEARVHDHAGDDQRKKDDAEEQQHALAPVENDPSNIEGDRERDQGDAQANEKNDISR